MSIKIFHTPFQYKGSTENLLRTAIGKINDNDYSKILYIAPTPRKVRDTQKIFHKFSQGCYIPPEMMTIKQLSKRLYSLYEDNKVIPQFLVPIVIARLSEKGIGFASIITNFINEIKQYHTGKDIETISDELRTIFQELGIHDEILVRTMEALRIFKEYQELLNKHSAVDENDVMAACPGLIERYNYNPVIIILDGFYELTGSEEAIIKALIENAKDAIISIPYSLNFTFITDSYKKFIKNNFQSEGIYLSIEKEPTEPFYHPYPGIEEEIEGIARNIKTCFISGRIKDLEKIAITFPMLHKYKGMLARIFKKIRYPVYHLNLKASGKDTTLS